MHLLFDMIGAYYAGEIRHPPVVLRSLGVTYKHAVPQSIADAWQFFCCENVPATLPSYIRVMNVEPLDLIGCGLSEEIARTLTTIPEADITRYLIESKK